MRKFGLVIVGGGLAGARAIKAYRAAGGEGRIALLSKDAVLPYHRPPLSKGYLRDEFDEAPFVEDQAFYAGNDVEVLLGTSVAAVAPAERSLTTTRGQAYGYKQLLIASGARPRRLEVRGAELDGVFTLRSLADSGAIRDAARGVERAVVVGGGFIGMEVAASLRRLGLEVTLIHLGRGLFDQLARLS
jgi:3-phenylpropionate/trans-cinnamate dioxygenase ferredoxin reductase subunit